MVQESTAPYGSPVPSLNQSTPFGSASVPGQFPSLPVQATSSSSSLYNFLIAGQAIPYDPPFDPFPLWYIARPMHLHVIPRAMRLPQSRGAWLTLLLAGWWRPEPTWIDRFGRALGAAWLAVSLVYHGISFFCSIGCSHEREAAASPDQPGSTRGSHLRRGDGNTLKDLACSLGSTASDARSASVMMPTSFLSRSSTKRAESVSTASSGPQPRLPGLQSNRQPPRSSRRERRSWRVAAFRDGPQCDITVGHHADHALVLDDRQGPDAKCSHFFAALCNVSSGPIDSTSRVMTSLINMMPGSS